MDVEKLVETRAKKQKHRHDETGEARCELSNESSLAAPEQEEKPLYLSSFNKLSAVTLRVVPMGVKNAMVYYPKVLGFSTQKELEKDVHGQVLSELQSLFLPQVDEDSPHVSADVRLLSTAKDRYYKHGPDDVYWKIGLVMHDVDAAAAIAGYADGYQFRDIGYMQHIQDPSGFMIEFLQTSFEESIGLRKRLWNAQEQEIWARKFQQSEDANSLARYSVLATQPLVVGQITTRVRDDKAALDFYQNVLGMKLLSKQEVVMSQAGRNFVLYFLGFTEDEPPVPDDLTDVRNREWTWQRRYTTLELKFERNRDASVARSHNGFKTVAEDLENLPAGLDSLQIEVNDAGILKRIRNHSTFEPSSGVIEKINEGQVVLQRLEKVCSVRDPDMCLVHVVRRLAL